MRLMTRYVDPGEQSVGYRVDVRHLAPTVIGKQVTAKVTLREVNGRRYVFDVRGRERGRREDRRGQARARADRDQPLCGRAELNRTEALIGTIFTIWPLTFGRSGNV